MGRIKLILDREDLIDIFHSRIESKVDFGNIIISFNKKKQELKIEGNNA